MDQERIKYLLAKRKSGAEFGSDEQNDWNQLIGDPANQPLVELWVEELVLNNTIKQGLPQENVTDMLSRITGSGQTGLLQGTGSQPRQIQAVHRIHFLRRGLLKYAAAIILFIGIGAYLYTTTKAPVKTTPTTAQTAKADVQPGGNKAILTLSTGQQVSLNDSLTEIITDGELAIQNTNGQLSYNGGSPIPSTGGVAAPGANSHLEPSGGVAGVGSNTMTTPKGGQYILTLADGTKVWLNAASSITYPTAFVGAERSVYVTGEAYFEVVKNKGKPFIVNTPEESITVLGTSFNVNVYADENGGKTSLLEGSVKIDGKLLKPGQAYSLGAITGTNIQRDIAWKNGLFNFQNVGLEQAMRQLARWYNIEVKYKGVPRNVEFGGEIPKSLTLQEVISGMEGIEKLHLELNGRTLTVFL
jgi:transmembrane sensor